MKIVKPLLVFIALTCTLATAQETNNRYLVILQSFKKPTTAQAAKIEQQMNTLGRQGFSPYLIQTDDYPPLHKGLWAIVLGPFNKEIAKAKQQSVQTWVADAYVKAVTPPIAKQEKYGFTTLKTSLSEGKCIAIGEDNEAGGINELCPGVNGQSLYLYIGDMDTQFAINQLRHEGGFMPAPEREMPLGLSVNYPLTWIYRDGVLTALSGVFESNHLDTNVFNDYRLLINVGKKQLCPVKKLFEKDNINAVLTYLNDNPSNCP